MRKSLLFFSFALLFSIVMVSCTKETNESVQEEFIEEVSADSRSSHNDRNCKTMPNLNKRLKNNPGLAKKMEAIEKHTQRVNGKKPNNPGGGNGNGGGGNGGDGGGEDPTPFIGQVSIPVYVHVIYSNSGDNISNAQIQSQIDVLNADFGATNGDAGQTPAEFAGLVTDTEINFTWNTGDINRVASSRTSWGTNDDMKSSANGGSDVFSPATHLNIWVCNIGGGILGYAQFPGGSSATDGIVVGTDFFGTTGTATAPFNGGRTTTHEVGHWLNLRHIWGDGKCKRDDFVTDTPSSDRPNYGCPSYPTVHCRSNDLTMNYMDYVDDACMYMFTAGQTDRMRALFATGGARESIVNN